MRNIRTTRWHDPVTPQGVTYKCVALLMASAVMMAVLVKGGHAAFCTNIGAVAKVIECVLVLVAVAIVWCLNSACQQFDAVVRHVCNHVIVLLQVLRAEPCCSMRHKTLAVEA